MANKVTMQVNQQERVKIGEKAETKSRSRRNRVRNYSKEKVS